tara:strand:+ start:5092 stop:6087 length:996 start_codon:yes stop_codon:yes gene_type:complete
MKYRTLGDTGLEISILGFGGASLGDIYRKTGPKEGEAAVHAAIDGGINYFDVAPLYGFTLAEERLGKALKGKRDEILLATKCCRDKFGVFDFSAQRVTESIDESLVRLKTDHVDVYQIHDVEFGTNEQIVKETFDATRAVQESGKARFVGITGFPVRYLRKVAEQVKPDTVMSWGHYTLVEDEMVTEFKSVVKNQGIGLLNASPLLQGLLTENLPPEWHRAPSPVLEMAPRIAKLCRDEHGVDVAQVALRHALDCELSASVVVGMSTPSKVERNLAALDLDIPKGLFDRIFELTKPIKNMMWFEGRDENNLPPSDPNQYVPTNPDMTHSDE